MGGYDDDSYQTSRGPALGLRASFFIVLSIGLMIADGHSRLLGSVREAATGMMRPFEQAATWPSLTDSIRGQMRSRESLLAENVQLLHERLLLRARLQKLDALEAENGRLRALLKSAQSLDQNVLVAEILDVSNDPYRHQIKLNKGRKDGIFLGQALIDAYGILGQVSEVFADSAVAILITDAKSSIPVEINRNGLRSIARGQGTNQLSLPFLPTNADVREGDLLVSSGLGGRYPAGYPVAKVLRVDNQVGLEFLGLQAAPTAELHHGHQVLLLTPQARQTATPPPDTAKKPAPVKRGPPR